MRVTKNFNSNSQIQSLNVLFKSGKIIHWILNYLPALPRDITKSRKINDKCSQEPQASIEISRPASSKQKVIIQDNREISLLKIALINEKGERQRRRPAPSVQRTFPTGCNIFWFFSQCVERSRINLRLGSNGRWDRTFNRSSRVARLFKGWALLWRPASPLTNNRHRSTGDFTRRI